MAGVSFFAHERWSLPASLHAADPRLSRPPASRRRLQAINKKLSSEKDDLIAQLKSVSQSLSAMEQAAQQAAKKQQELVNKVRTRTRRREDEEEE